MNHKTLLITSLSVAVLAVGCKPSAEKSVAENGEATAQQFEKVKTETKEAAQTMKDYTYVQKTEFVATMDNQLAQLKRDLDLLAVKIEKSSDAAQAEAKPKLQALREQTAKLNTKLEEARNATESTWDDVKAGFKKAYGELQDGFKQARQWVSDKISP